MQSSSVSAQGSPFAVGHPGLHKQYAVELFSLKAWYRLLYFTWILLAGGALAAAGATLPRVAIHDSELTRALDGLAATNPGTPSGTGTNRGTNGGRQTGIIL